jgi:hypothetical protein
VAPPRRPNDDDDDDDEDADGFFALHAGRNGGGHVQEQSTREG